MPAVKLLEIDDVDNSIKELYRETEEHFGQVPNLVKALGNNPTLCKSITRFMIQAMGKGRISWSFKELIILKTLRAMKSYYSYGAHEQIAADLGVSNEKIGDLANSLWQNSPHFDEGEKAVFELIDQIAEDANDVSDALWDRLKQHWENGQLIEINAVITTFIMIGRIGDSMGVSDPKLFSKPISNN